MKEISGRDRQVLDQIIAALKKRGEVAALFAEDDVAGIERFRALGRRAGRQLRWKVRTFATDPARRADRCVAVWVVVTEDSPLRQQLAEIRMRKVMERLDATLSEPPEQ